jgi:hypothetical protein
LEDRAHDRDPCAQLDIVPINAGIRSNDNRVFQTAEHDVAKGKEMSSKEKFLPEVV